MKTYTIYTTGSSEPLVIEVDYDLLEMYKTDVRFGVETFTIKYYKDHIGIGRCKHEVVLNMRNIVSISTSEKD